MRTFPYLSLGQALITLRVATAGLFMAHAIVRLVNGTIPQFGAFLDSKGLPFGVPLVWMITGFEIVGGSLMALGIATRWLAAGFFGILAMGIVLIHWPNGWFVGEHGTGGSEYSVALMVSLVVIAAASAAGLQTQSASTS